MASSLFKLRAVVKQNSSVNGSESVGSVSFGSGLRMGLGCFAYTLGMGFDLVVEVLEYVFEGRE